MMTPALKKISALILLLTFPFTQTGWSADAIQMIDGQPQAVADPFAAQTATQASAEPIDFLSETQPLSLPEEPALLPARLSLSSTAGLTSAHVTTLAGAPRIYLASGSTSTTTVQNPAANIVRMNYQASSVADFSGFMVSFDNASTANIETVSWSALTQVTLGLKGNASVVRLQIEDMNGNKDEIDLNGVSTTTEKFWRIQTASLSGSIDKSKIKSLRFLVSPANGAAAGSGFVDLRLGGVNLSAPAVPVVAAVPAFTNQSILTLSGTKEAQTAILINGVEVVGRNELTTWSVQMPLLIEGANAFSFTAKNMLGKLSAVKSVSVTKDTMMPAGTININSGALYATSRMVTLNLSATDNKSGVGTMSFSTDGRNWSAPETYKTSKSFVLPEGDGAKTVYVKYFDKAGNQSMAYFKSIVLDLLPPSGTVTVGNGSGFINSRTATLYLNALDAGSGLSKMSFSANGTTWTTAENYASQKSWAFPAGDGAKKVYVKFQDKSGKWSAPILVNTVLDTVKPVGALNINSGDTYARSNSVTLNLSASDVGGGVGSMSFSTDNVNWTSPEAFATSKTFELPSGDGSKTVFVKYFDKAGNASTVYSKSILLDSTAPDVGVVLFDGKTITRELSGNAAFTASDSGSGLEAVRYSLDQGATWTEWSAFTSQNPVSLPAGDGRKQIIYEARDVAGNIASSVGSITVDQTAPILELLTSASVVRVGVWVVEYLSDGILKSKSYQLSSGINALTLSETDEAGNTSSLNFNVEYEREWDVVLDNGTLQHYEAGILKYEILLEALPAGQSESNESGAENLSAYPSPPPEYEVQSSLQLPQIEVRVGENLQAAIDIAQAGQTVYLHPGTYNGHFILKSGVNLIGANQGSVVLHGNFESKKDVLQAMGDNRIENLTITGGGPYNWEPSSALNILGDHVLIRGNKISGNKDYGIYVSAQVSDVVIEKNLIQGNNVGVQLPKSGNQIRSNTFVGNNFAVNILNGTAPIVESNIITGSTYQSIYEFGYGLVPTNGRAIIRNNTLHNNAAKGGYSSLNLPPAIESLDGNGWTQGNILQNPQFVNPAAGNYAIQFGAPAFGRGAFVPEAWQKASARAAQFNLASVIEEVKVGGSTTGYKVVYPAGTVETFMNDGTETLDRVGPAIEIAAQNPNLVNQAEYDLIFTVDGSQQTKRFTLTEGDNLFTIEARDELGNRTAREFHVTLDTVPPQATLALSGYVSNDYFYDFPLTLNLNAVDQNSAVHSMRLSLDGGLNWTAWAGYQSVRSINWQEALSLYDYFGTNEVDFVAEFKDMAGNVGRATLTSTRDAEFPQGTISINNGAAFTKSREVTLSLTATDSISGVRGIHLIQYANDGSTFYDSGLIDFVTSKTIQLPPGDGLKTIQYGICDWASCIYKTAQINLDTTPPLIVLNTQIPTSTSNPNFIVDYTVDGVAKQKDFILVEGENTLSITETDSAGNTAINQIKINYLLTGDRQIVGGGLQHFEAGELQYQINADSSRVDFALDASIESYSFGLAQNNTKVLLVDHPQNELQILNSSSQLLKTISGLKPSAPNLSNALKVNLQDGVEAYYVNGVLKEVRTSTGIRMFDLVLSTPADTNQVPEILDASIAYPDGSVDIIWNKNLVRKFAPDGSIVDVLPNGKVGREIKGAVEQTYIDVYDPNGTFAGSKIVSSQGDEVVYDEKGILKSAISADGKRFIYDKAQTANGYLLTLNSALSGAPSAQTLVEGQYKATGEVVSLQLQNGSQISFENGKVKSAVNSEGAVIDYVTLLSNGLINGISINRENTNFKYDQSGFLTRIETNSGTIVRTQNDTNGDGVVNNQDTVDLLLELVGGDTLTDFELDADGKILNGLIKTREGITQKIQNGVLTEYQTADGRFYKVNSATGTAELDVWTFQDGMVVKYGGTSITEILFPNKKWNSIEVDANHQIKKYVEVLEDQTQRHFENGKLVKVKLPPVTPETQGVEIDYVDGLAVKVIRPNGVSEQVERVYDDAGKVIEIKLVSGIEARTYSPEGNLRQLLIAGLEASVQDDEITEIKSRFGRVVAPSFTNNQLDGNVELSDGRVLTVVGGVLTSMVLANGSVIDYQSGRISRVENSEGIYNLTYVMSGESLVDVKVNWTLKSSQPVAELVTETVPIIPQGDARLASTIGKFGSYLSLDGDGDYLSVSDSPDWDFGTGNFTVDFWAQWSDETSHSRLFEIGSYSIGKGISAQWSSNKMQLCFNATGGSTCNDISFQHAAGRWYHLAFVRDGNEIKFYSDGKKIGSLLLPSGAVVQTGGAGVIVGAWNGSPTSYNHKGSIDELRISNAVRWVSEFNPPTQEHIADSNTLFLHHFNQSSQFNSKYDGQPLDVRSVPVSVQGNTVAVSGSAVFDGAGDDLSVSSSNFDFGSGDFTLETKVKFDTVNQQHTIVADYNSGGWIWLIDPASRQVYLYNSGQSRVTFSTGAWESNRVYELSISRVGNQIRFFRDGVMEGGVQTPASNYTGDPNRALTIGSYANQTYLKGSMDWLRISKGIGRYSQNYVPSSQTLVPDSFTTLLHHFDSLISAQSVPAPMIVSAVGDAKIYMPQAVFSDAVYLSGSGDSIKSYDSDLLNFGTGDFTIDFRANFEQAKDGERYTFLARGDNTEFRLMRETNNRLELYFMGSVYDFDIFKPEMNKWYHIALVRKNGQIKLYVDGVAHTAQFNAGQLTQYPSNSPTTIGAWYLDNRNPFIGMMDEFRISDSARWSSNFSAPTTAYTVDKNTRFLHHFDDLARAEAGYEILKYGIVPASEKGIGAISRDQLDRAAGSQSLRLSSSGSDSLTVSGVSLNLEDYTVEGWFKSESISPTAGIWSQVKDSQNFIALQASGGKLVYQVIKNGIAVVYLEANQTTPLNQWNHFAVTKQGSKIMIYLNGQQVANGLVSDAVHPDLSLADFNFGWYQNWPSSGWVGRMDELRISNSARYPSNFSPNKEILQVDQDTLYLHHGEGSGVKAGVDFKAPSGEMSLSRYLLENPTSEFSRIVSPRPVENIFDRATHYQLQSSSSRQISIQGDVKVSTDGEKFKFDGSGDGLTVSGSNLDFGSGDFTLEAKVRFDSIGGTQTIVADYAEGGVGWIWTIDTSNNQALLYDSGWNPIYFSMPPLQAGTFYEMAIVRKGNQVMFFRDGVMYGGVQTPRTNYVGSVGKPLQIGYYDSVSSYLNGLIDRLRITKGVGRYSSNYVVATNYTRDAGTEVLLNFTTSEFAQKLEMTVASGTTASSLGKVDLSNWVKDFQYGNVQSISGFLNPNEKIYTGSNYYSRGYLSENVTLDIHDNLPSVTADLVDMNGDGFTDRVFVDESFNFWWIQLGNGSGFGELTRWEGVDRQIVRTGPYYNVPASLKFYEGRHPHVLGDLFDINGDDRPDRVLQKYDGSREWYVQINNGSGFDAIEIWDDNIQAASQWSFQATYASEVRDDQGGQAVQPLIADLIDLDGDGLLDRVVRPKAGITTPNPYDHWFFQKNNGHGFDEPTIWTGVNYSFASTAELGASLSWYQLDSGRLADVSDLMDMNGDGLPDRILLKNKNTADSYSAFNWYVQFNNGSGFHAPVLWDQDVRSVPNAPFQSMATSLRFFRIEEQYRNYYVNLLDVTGDGLPDRVTMNRYDEATATPQNKWWVEVNTGSTFAPAVEWSGIEGDNLSQSSIGIDNDNTKSGAGGGRVPSWVQQVADLKDMNNDGILDRIYFKAGTSEWRIQYGTGNGFLPSQPMVIQSVKNEAITDHYDYVHINLRSDDAVLAAQGKVVVKLLDENNQIVQTWDIVNLGTSWKDHYLPLNLSKKDGQYLEMSWQYNAGISMVAPQILVSDVGLTAFRPNASAEWLDYLLTENTIVDRVNQAAHENLAAYLGSSVAGPQTFDWNSLLAVETKIQFNSETGKVESTEKANGEKSTVTYSGGNAVISTALPDGKVTKITVPENNAVTSQTQTQTIHYDNQTPNNLADDYSETATIAYGRIRSITRIHENKADLQYSYEFDAIGREITVVYDPDSKETEKYRVFDTQNGEESRVMARIVANGVETRFSYNSKGDLTRTEIVYMGRVRETFDHSVTGDGLHALKTESGMTELYDSTGKLVAHITPEGYRYTHTFGNAQIITTGTRTESVVLCDPATDQYGCAAVPLNQRTLTVTIPTVTLSTCTTNCDTVHQVTLASYNDKDGNQVSYDGSEIQRIELAGGTQIDFDGFTEEEITDSQTGQIQVVRRPKNVIIFHSDGSITEFKDGKPYSVTSATGRVIDIQPDLSASDQSPVVLINPSAAAEFHYAEALKLWNATVLLNFEKYSLKNGMVVQTEYTADGTKPITRLFAEGAREIYDENGKIEYVVAEDGEQLIDYDYEASGDLAAIHLQGSRRRLAQAVLELKIEVAMKRYDALVDLAYAGQVARETTEGQYLVQRDRLLALKAQIESQRNQVASIKVKGKSGKGMLAGAMNQINAGIGQVNQALYQLLENRNQALENINQQTTEISAKIENETAQAYMDIAVKEKEMQDSILTQEISPVVYHWYRKILGRDPSKAEYDAAKARANYTVGTFDLAGLKSMLINSTELADRRNEVNQIRSAVRAELELLLTLSQTDRKGYAENLLRMTQANTPADAAGIWSVVSSLNRGQIDAILAWLDSQSLHFGQSAYIALESLLLQAGIQKVASAAQVTNPQTQFTRLNLATSLILIDILTGTLTPIEKGDLVLSMFAMKTYAARFGVEAEAYAMNWDALKSLVLSLQSSAGASQGVVAHVDGNHFIVITNITTRVVDGKTIEEVHYTDPGAGKDGDEKVVVNKEDFLKVWKNASANVSNSEPRAASPEFGYILSPRAPPASQVSSSDSRVLSATESMQVRGAFFGLIIGLFIAAVIIVGIIAQISSILNAIKSILHGIADTFIGFVTFDFKRVWSGIKEHFFGGLQLLTTLLEAPFVGLGVVLEAVGVPTKIAQTVVAAGRIIAGVVLVAASPFAGPAAPLVAGYGISLVGRGAGDILRLHTSLNPKIISVIEIGAQVVGAVVGAGFGAPGPGFNFQSALASFKDMAPRLAADFASAGFVALGNHLGWDPRLTGLLSIPVSAVASGLAGGIFKDNFVVGINPETGAKIVVPNTKSLLDYVGGSLKNSLPQTISLGASMLGLGNGFTAGAITGAVSQLLGNPDLLKNTANLVGNLLLHPRAVIGATAESISSLFTKMNDKIKEKGFVGAVGDWIGQMFDRKTQEAIYSAGGVGNVLNGGGVNTTFNNQVAKEYSFGNGSSIFTDLLGNMIGKTENGVTQSGTFGLNSAGKFGLITGKIFANMLGGFAFAGTVDSGALVGGEITQGSERILQFSGTGPEGQSWVGFQMPQDNPQTPQGQSGFSWSNLALNLVQLGMSFTFNSGSLDLVNVNVGNNQNQAPVDGGRDIFILSNGINNTAFNVAHIFDRDFNAEPDYFQNLEDDLVDLTANDGDESNDISENDVFISSIYWNLPSLNLPVLDTIDTWTDRIKDVIKLLINTQLPVPFEPVVWNLQFKILNSYFQSGANMQDDPVVAVGYSGGFAPLVEAINRLNLPLTSLVGIGAATINMAEIGDVLNVFDQTMELIASKDIANADKITEGIEKMFSFIPFVGGVIGTVLGIIISGIADFVEAILDLMLNTSAQAVDLFEQVFRSIMDYTRLQEVMRLQNLIGLQDLEHQDAAIVNVWGDEDPLFLTGIAGQMSTIGGVLSGSDNLFDIEIQSWRDEDDNVLAYADHYNYVRGIRDYNDPNVLPDQADFDILVADFTTRLIEASRGGEDAVRGFLRQQGYQPDARGVWIVEL